MNGLFWNVHNSAVYKITSTNTYEPKVWQGGATTALLFIFSNQGKRGASLCPSELALHLQYNYKKIRRELLTINFEIQKVPF